MIESSLNKLKDLQPLQTSDIINWLAENKLLLNRAIDDTSCYKWKKWRRDNNSRVFPCITHLCLPLNEECRFIEFYKQMQDFIKKIRTEHFYNNQLQVYERIKHNEKAVFEWIIDIEKYGRELTLIEDLVYFNDEKGKGYLVFSIDRTERQNLWKFKDIFEDNYHSYEFDEYRKIKF